VLNHSAFRKRNATGIGIAMRPAHTLRRAPFSPKSSRRLP
jgi:hypothetical protein